MLPNDTLNILPKINGIYRKDVSLAPITWFRAGGKAEFIYKPSDSEDLKKFLRTKSKEIPYFVLGVGSNVIIRDEGFLGVVIRLGKGFNNIALHSGYLDVGASVLDSSVAKIAGAEGLQDLAFLCGIPGTIGGGLRMNAGCYGSEIKDVLEAAFAIDHNGQLQTLTVNDMGFGYRKCMIPDDWIFIGARFRAKVSNKQSVQSYIKEIISKRENTQPIRAKTGGSTFANPEGYKAWELIDKAGCRGMKFGGAQVSEKHCNFLINTDEATASDLENLGEIVKRKVLEVTGIELHWEIHRLGNVSSQCMKQAV